MRNRISSLLIFLVGGSLFSLPAAAQIYIPGTPAQKEAAEKAKPPKYDPRDFSRLRQIVASGWSAGTSHDEMGPGTVQCP
jgi:hypothetical protein